MPLEHLTLLQALGGLLVTLAAVLSAIGVIARFLLVPKLREFIVGIVAAEFTKREAAEATLAKAEQVAIEDLGERIHRIEERMSENEKAAAETQATVARIEEATKRQTVTLEAIAEGIGDIKETLAVQKEKTARAEKDIEDLQRATRRRTR
jgi:methyl-accepting chemotaxis protein